MKTATQSREITPEQLRMIQRMQAEVYAMLPPPAILELANRIENTAVDLGYESAEPFITFMDKAYREHYGMHEPKGSRWELNGVLNQNPAFKADLERMTQVMDAEKAYFELVNASHAVANFSANDNEERPQEQALRECRATIKGHYAAIFDTDPTGFQVEESMRKLNSIAYEAIDRVLGPQPVR